MLLRLSVRGRLSTSGRVRYERFHCSSADLITGRGIFGVRNKNARHLVRHRLRVRKRARVICVLHITCSKIIMVKTANIDKRELPNQLQHSHDRFW